MKLSLLNDQHNILFNEWFNIQANLLEYNKKLRRLRHVRFDTNNRSNPEFLSLYEETRITRNMYKRSMEENEILYKINSRELSLHSKWEYEALNEYIRCENENRNKECGGWYCREGTLIIGTSFDVLSIALIPFGGLPSGLATGVSIANNVITVIACKQYAIPAASTALNVGSLTASIKGYNKLSIGLTALDVTVGLGYKYFAE